MDSGILMIQDSILVCSPDPRIPHTAAYYNIYDDTMIIIYDVVQVNMYVYDV
jgi:hypothetical protein